MKEQHMHQAASDKIRQIKPLVTSLKGEIDQFVYETMPKKYEEFRYSSRGVTASGIVTQDRLVSIFVETVAHFRTQAILLEGKENIREAQRLLDDDAVLMLMANHTFSHYSTVAIEQGLKRNGFNNLRNRLFWPLGTSLQENKFAQYVLRMVPYIEVWPKTKEAKTEDEKRRRDAMNMKALRTGAHVLRNGGVLAWYPEGTRGEGPEMGPAMVGTEQYLNLVQDREMAILPISITGTEEVLPKGEWLPINYPMKVKFGDVVLRSELQKKYGGENKDEKLKLMMHDIMETIAEGLPEKNRGYYKKKKNEETF